MINTQKLINELKQFTGSNILYNHSSLFLLYSHTEGVRHLAKTVNCYWLLDYIFTNQKDAKLKSEPFQTWTINVKEDKTATIKVTDGNKQELKSFKLDYTDFPRELCSKNGFTLWLIDKTILLPNEY